MRISLIWAMARNRVIGRAGGLPWTLPDDMRFFKTSTLGKPVIMGRRTFDSMGRPLPGRDNIVLSRAGIEQADVHGVSDLDAALELAREICTIKGQDEAMVIGGAQIYALALPHADRLYQTTVDADVEGDTFFPAFDESAFRELECQVHAADGRHAHGFTIRVLERVR